MTPSDNPLFDSTLSVKVAGIEYAALAGALQFESVGPGGFGPASFEVYPDDPFDIPATFPELVNEAEVIVKHGEAFSATGGTVSTDGAYTVHTFTEDGTLECTGTIEAEGLLVAGGGGAARSGGGAGGYLTGAETLTGSMAVTVGGGGPKSIDCGGVRGTVGGDTIFGTRTAKGGGVGAPPGMTGGDGASGGGGTSDGSAHAGGAATPSGQGNAGGECGVYVASPYPTGGGGGAGAAGGDASGASTAGNGGAGLNSDIVQRGTNVGYAGGGGGSVWSGGTYGTASHGGGAGGATGTNGTANTGGGGGGSNSANRSAAGAGGSGIVVVRYLTPRTILYEGHIVGDPTIAKLENGESIIAVECGGLLDTAKYRQDYGSTSVDPTYDNWQRHRASDKGFADTIDGKLRFDVNDGQTFTAGDIAGIFYRVNQGIVTSPDDTIQALDFEYDLALASAAWHCDIWAAPYYVDTLAAADWATGFWAQSETTAEGTAHVTGFPAGTRCVAFVIWVSGNGDSLAKRHAEITNLRVNCFDAASATPTVDEAMVGCGVVTGLATASDTETIGNPLAQCVIPPSTTRADGLDKFASMYEAPVDWGFWDDATLRVKKRLNSPADDAEIRALAGAGTAPAAYLLDATTPAFDYDVHKYEEGKFDYVRAIFSNSRTNRVATPNPTGDTWPADWSRSDATYVTALSSRFKFDLSGASCIRSAYTFAVPPLDTDYIECRIPFTVTVPAGTEVRFFAQVDYYTSADVYIDTQYITYWIVAGPVTAAAHVLKGSGGRPWSTMSAAKAAFTVGAELMTGSGSTTVECSPVDFHDMLPGGMLRTVCAPSEPPADADVKVGILDLTDRGDLTVDRAFAVATQALAWIDSTLETGTIEVFSPTVPIYGGGTKLAAYIRASDWVECQQVSDAAELVEEGSSRPLWISSSHVDVDEGVTTLTIEPYPFDVAESDFGHAHMSRLRRWKKARRGMYRRQKAALRKAQAKENKTKLGPGHKRRVHYI